MRKLLMATTLASAVTAGGVQAQHAGHAPATATQLGKVDFPNSGNAAAQAPFIEGVKLLHNFDYPRAAKAFQKAQSADPDFALAYWGEAMAQNETLWANQDRDAALKARAKFAPTREARAARAKTPRERAWIDAVETLYGEGTKSQRDVAYADKMDALAKAFPDTEAIVFDALATLGRSHGTGDFANYARAGAMLEPLLAKYPDHPGVAHYIIHSYDDPANAAKGLAAARVYDRLAPGSPHAQHMVSHIFLALGMWPDVERANIQAGKAAVANWGMDEKTLACGHGGIWLAYARLQEGKEVGAQLDQCREVAVAALGKAKKIPIIGTGEGLAGSAADIAVRQGVEMGKWTAPIALPLGKLNLPRFTYLYGEVLSARGDAPRARSALDGMEAAHALIAANFKAEYPDDDQMMPWLDLALAQARAVALLAGGKHDEGMATLRAAAARERALPPAFGPPLVQKPTWELLGDELLAAGDKAGAMAAYRESLALQPGRRLSLAGLRQATD